LAESVDAAIIIDSSLNGTVIGWNVGNGQTPSVTRNISNVGGFTLGTRATAGGGPDASGFIGAVAVWNGNGGFFRRSSASFQSAALAGFGAPIPSYGLYPWANINLAYRYSGQNVNYGNQGFTTGSKYLQFQFNNHGTVDYGWIEIKSMQTPLTGGYTTTLGNWAYDNSGAMIAAGQMTAVPEPSSAAAAMGGALVAGGVALRRWRKKRDAQQSVS